MSHRQVPFAAAPTAATSSRAVTPPTASPEPAGNRPGAPSPSKRTLFGVALSFGVVNAVYWSFAVDLISGARPSAGPLLYVALGAFGSAGLATGDAVARFGLGRTLSGTLAALGVAAGLLGLAPGSLAAVGASAVLFGSGVMFMSALLSVRSSAVFRERPSTGFSAALLLFGVGSIAGPTVVGATADRYGLERIFLLIGALAISTALVRPASEDAA